MKRVRLQSLFLHVFGMWKRTGWGGRLVRAKPKEACRHWICHEQIINFFFPPCTLLNLLERDISSRAVTLAPGQHAKFCHLLRHGQASLLHVTILGLGWIQQSWYSIRWLGVWKGKGLYSSPGEVLQEVSEQYACCTCIGHGFLFFFFSLHRCHKHLVCAVSNLNHVIHFCSYRLSLDWRQIWAILPFWAQHFPAAW